jgi:hypothetical protein
MTHVANSALDNLSPKEDEVRRIVAPGDATCCELASYVVARAVD